MQAIIIDAGTGNLHSDENALRSLGFYITVTSNPADCIPGRKIVLPGVGAYGKFMDGLHNKGLDKAIQDVVQSGTPILGICVGMQALFDFGEEKGIYQGLSLLPGKVVRFSKMTGIKIPHTGWNQLWFEPGSPLLRNIQPGAYAYFNHSYYCVPAETKDILTTTDYGISYCSSVQRKNIFGVQFHPEKSQNVGLQILKNFLDLEWEG
jgi:glutamine amidotransferase